MRQRIHLIQLTVLSLVADLQRNFLNSTFWKYNTTAIYITWLMTSVLLKCWLQSWTQWTEGWPCMWPEAPLNWKRRAGRSRWISVLCHLSFSYYQLSDKARGKTQMFCVSYWWMNTTSNKVINKLNDCIISPPPPNPEEASGSFSHILS